MNFEEVKQHYEEQGWIVRLYNDEPDRIMRITKIYVEFEYDEAEWMKLSEEEQMDEIQGTLEAF